jgi:uncharacterized protein
MTLVGAGYRPEVPGLFHGEEPAVDCAELVADRYFGEEGFFSRAWELRGLAGVPTIAHGLCGNTASVHGPDRAYLERIRRLVDAIDAIAYSDHMALTGVTGRALGHLAPNLFDDELVAAAARNIATMVDVTGRRPCLENLATKTMITGSAYTVEEFYVRLLDVSDQWDCLIDLTNIWINSQNRDVDPLWFIDSIPAERVGYIHLAGGIKEHGEWVDSHSHAVHGEVFELLDYLLARAAPIAVIIERDQNFAGAEAELRADLGRVRQIVAKHQGETGRRRPDSRAQASPQPTAAGVKGR